MNERRRTLLFSGGYKIPTENGVYIESIDHEFYLTDDWDSANTANSIAVVTDAHKFRIALTDAPSMMQMHSYEDSPWENFLPMITDLTPALADYSGASNTQLIIEKGNTWPPKEYAAGWCNAYTFPDGTTKGYLPAFGEMYLASQYYAAIKTAFSACGGTMYEGVWHWSSTFFGVDYYGVDAYKRKFWLHALTHNGYTERALNFSGAVRPFAILEDSN